MCPAKDLEHTLLCVDDDMRMEALRQTNYVKSIVTAQGQMDLERKGKQSYQGWMCARLLAFSNGDLQALFDLSLIHISHVGLGAVGTAVYDLGGGMMGDRIVELILHRCEKLLCDGAFHIVVGAALGIDVRDLLVEPSLAGPDVP